MNRDVDTATGLARSLLDASERADGIARAFVGDPRLINGHWVFGYSSRRFVEDGDVMAALAGNGPIAVPIDETWPPFHLSGSTPAEVQLSTAESARFRPDPQGTRMIAQEEAAARLRAELEASSHWRELYRDQHPRILGPRHDRVVEMRAFDIDEWVEVAPGGVYEYWFSERGQAHREFRTADLAAICVFLVQTGLASAGKSASRASIYEPPPGFRFSQSANGPVVVEWGDDRWAEFERTGNLGQALRFAWLMLADPDAVAATVRSRDGAPLRWVGSGPSRPALPPDATVASWKEWLAQRDREPDA